jgi:hypothetical protein
MRAPFRTLLEWLHRRNAAAVAPAASDPNAEDARFAAAHAQLKALGAGLYRSDPFDGPTRYFVAVGARVRKVKTIGAVTAMAVRLRDRRDQKADEVSA